MRYNYACMCSLSGRFEEAFEVLRGLLSIGGASKEDLAVDEDFSSVREQAWFQSLLKL